MTDSPTYEAQRVTPGDIDAVYQFALTIPELVVDEHGPFMQPEEFRFAVTAPDALAWFVRGLHGTPVGFLLARGYEADRPDSNSGCIVYLAVNDHCRRYGIATKLMEACRADFKRRSITRVYAWADESSGVIEFFERFGMRRGKRCLFMEGAAY